MRLLKKVSAREVKRCFVIGNGIRTPKQHRKHLGVISFNEFEKRLTKQKQKVLRLTTDELNRRIKWKARIHSYSQSDWYLGEVKTNEAGIWRRAGELPLSWTNDSLAETADKVRRGLKNKSKSLSGRARKAIMGILRTNVNMLQKEKYLLPIIFKGGTGTDGRHGLKHKTKYDIDDGCMRSIALAVNGAKVIRAYIGFPKKKKVK